MNNDEPKRDENEQAGSSFVPQTEEHPQMMQIVVSRPKRSFKTPLIVVGVLLLLGATAFGFWQLGKNSSTADKNKKTASSQSQTNKNEDTPTVQGLQLDTNKNYGNKYADGILPVGDSKYVTTGAQKGNIYVCRANFVPAGQAGAQTRGPWFTNNNTEYDLNKKAKIQGNVNWTPSMTNTVQGDKRIIATNDLPNHHTGVFPVGKNDPARVYDANPNSISAQTLTYSLAANPSYGTPQCVGGEVGVMLTGVALFDGFDAGGRDAGAWEVQDDCGGHPQNKGEYHYHTLSSCITDQSVKTVIGFALDGFPITGPKVGENNILTTDDLDECHGITSKIMLDGKEVTSYHYVMTQDFPYSVSCFRATPVKAPGLPE